MIPMEILDRIRRMHFRDRLSLWAYVGAAVGTNDWSEWIEHPVAALYEFTDCRRGAHAKRVLGAYRGYRHADAQAGFDAL